MPPGSSEDQVPASQARRRSIASFIVGVLAGAAIASLIAVSISRRPVNLGDDRLPHDSPIEVAGNSAHVCTPFSNPTPSGSSWIAPVDTTSTAYFTRGDVTGFAPIPLRTSWKQINFTTFGTDVNLITLVAGQPDGSGSIPVTVTSQVPMNPAASGHAVNAVCPAGQPGCDHLGDVVFLDAQQTEITRVPCETNKGDGKCLISLGTSQTHPAFQCKNQ